ncbi:Ark- serine/threonine protein kinase [Lecanora helva]
MATAFNAPVFAPSVRQPAYQVPASAPAPAVPNGTFVPGTKVQVGGHRVVIEKYLSEGGFAHVYLVRLPQAVDGEDAAVLKRVAVPDKEALANMRTEVETMKKLKGRLPIVTYIDSHASQLKGGGYEVFLLMEYCNGGGLIDFMNTRLQNRLTEPEILKIFSDVAQGVACMHYLKPPLLHRDLKVENVLITASGSSRKYKLCDFGSAAPPRPPATSAAEGRLIEDDVQKHTTLQYRSPEMIDVYRKQPIDEKSDIWALGVLLYKLCYYKTPFEEQGQMAILNASFKYPGYPTFSDQIKKLIASMLRENPQQRPNIYQVVREVSKMRGTDVPIKDIYAGRTQSESRRNQHLPPPEPNVASPPIVGAFQAPPAEEQKSIPDITPMRRGRPTKTEGDSRAPKPSPSPLRGAGDDPWAALESGSINAPENGRLDDASIRFPPLDEFSLLHDSGSKFAFDPKKGSTKRISRDISQRVTDALADDVFAQAKTQTTSNQQPSSTSSQAVKVKPKPTVTDVPKPEPIPDIITQQTTPQKPSMVSTGTMTSPSDHSPKRHNSENVNRPIFHFPDSSQNHRSSSQPRASDSSELAAASLRADVGGLKRPAFLENRSKSQILINDNSQSPQPSSLETNRGSLNIEGGDSAVHRSKSANSRARPTSVQTPAKPNLLRRMSREKARPDDSKHERFSASIIHSATGDVDDGEDAVKIDSDVDFLKAMEDEDISKRKEKRLSSGSRHIKRASMPSVSLSGTKNLLAGRFGDAFKRFEGNGNGNEQRDSSQSPVLRASGLTPIAGSEATDGRSDDGQDLEESEEIPPEMRRELERQRLAQEEKRVADAAAAYRQRIAQGSDGTRGRPSGGPANNKAISIQSKVKTLLDESGRASPSPTKTASGYGRFTDSPVPEQPPLRNTQQSHPPRTTSRQQPSFNSTQPQQPPSLKPSLSTASPLPPPSRQSNHPSPPQQSFAAHTSSNSAPPPNQAFNRPSAPPKPQTKPQNLRTGDRGPQSPAKPPRLVMRKPLRQQLQQPPQPPPSSNTASGDGTDEDWETSFSKRYPDLAGLEMVETELDRSGAMPSSQRSQRETRVRDV